MPDLPADAERKQLIPPELAAKLPAWGSTAAEADPLALVKFVLPSDIGAVWTWYLVEYDGQDRCFGLVIGSEIETGYFSLSELEGLYAAMQTIGLAEDFRRAGASGLSGRAG